MVINILSNRSEWTFYFLSSVQFNFTISEEKPTLILLDWMLPVYDGITVLRRIRKVSDIPIIMLTARNQAYDISNALDQGLDDYMTKPFEIKLPL